MSELRQDPIVGRWVIIAKNRAQRPHEFLPAPLVRRPQACPFCEGSESQTPDEIFALRDPPSAADGPGWRVRVVPNKFPALSIDGQPPDLADRGDTGAPGFGAHEVIIETPRHLANTSQLSQEELRDVLLVYRQRLTALKRDGRLTAAMIFKNVGAAAGASLEHLHSQVIGLPMAPRVVADEMAGAATLFSQHGECAYCAMLKRELGDGRRVVFDTPGFVAFCPFASRFPLETWVLPKSHASHYEEITEAASLELAHVLRQTVLRLERCLDRPAYNWFVHSTPFDTQAIPHYHWHIEVIPSVTKVAGFEWGSGLFINPVPPEDAAAMLREAESEWLEPKNIRAGETG